MSKQPLEAVIYQTFKINLNSLVYPLFVREGRGVREEIPSMPGIYRFSPDTLIKEAESLWRLGVTTVLLFGIAGRKDETGRGAYEKGNIVSKSVSLLKRYVPTLTVITDVCLCAYTSHGHCGVLEDSDTGRIDNEHTLSALAMAALLHAEAGADCVAPSAMAKKQVGVIRGILDKNGHRDTEIIGYSAKFASQFYGPFREAADSAPRFGDRRSYQLDYFRTEDALAEIEDDIAEGADIVMVKPALSYLDVIREAKRIFKYPLAAYSVSGEYAMVKTGASQGYWDEKKMVFETFSAIRRAGADFVITYHARDIAEWLKEGK